MSVYIDNTDKIINGVVEGLKPSAIPYFERFSLSSTTNKTIPQLQSTHDIKYSKVFLYGLKNIGSATRVYLDANGTKHNIFTLGNTSDIVSLDLTPFYELVKNKDNYAIGIDGNGGTLSADAFLVCI